MIMKAGIDEVGRGCIAGPVVAACVWIDEDRLLDLAVTDSKKISVLKREKLSQIICQRAYSWGIGVATVAEVDRINILQATWEAMRRAHTNCWFKPEEVWIDGRDNPFQDIKAYTVIGGDAKIPSISAASIVAKVYRDSLMQVYDRQYPGYGFTNHKGYGTKAHMQDICNHGVCPIHRKSFAPVRDIIERETVQ